MKRRLFALLAALCIALGCLAGCETTPDNGGTTGSGNPVDATGGGDAVQGIDYAAQVKLDMNSGTLKQEVTVKTYVDGDTTHFHVPTSVIDNGLLKARYLGVNTPESTGKIEEYGKKASNFTKEKLKTAESIIIESDDGQWNADSTGGRYLVWVWYKPAGSDTYRNLNIELLQNGLSIASKSAENQYGQTCLAAIQQAKDLKLNVHSGKKDPDFYYGDAYPVTLKGLRTNIELYRDLKVTFEGIVTYKSNQTVYVEEYDAETDMYYGMTVYYGYNLTGMGQEILVPGNRVKIVGNVQYYETGATWQVADIKYVDMRPNDPNNIQLISENNEIPNRLTDPKTFNEGTIDTEVMPILDEEVLVPKTFDYAQMALSTSVRFENLRVNSVYTTKNEDSASKGAMTLYCTAGGQSIAVRTVVLYDDNGNVITADAYDGKVITVEGVVDYFSGDYQIKVFTPDAITIVG